MHILRDDIGKIIGVRKECVEANGDFTVLESVEEDDKYSKDASYIIEKARASYVSKEAIFNL